MKKCSYCGEEYPDDATVCAIDSQLLINSSSQLAAGDEQKFKTAAYLKFPEYKWSARDAWKSIVMLVIFAFIMTGVNHLFYSAFPVFAKSGPGSFLRSLLHYFVGLFAVVYFARTETLATFWKGFGLDRKPTELVWVGIVLALVIRFAGHFLRSAGLGTGVHNYELSAFRHTVGAQRYFFLLPAILLAPLFEECIYRGFLYKAFRGSYTIAVSIILIVAGQHLHTGVLSLIG